MSGFLRFGGAQRVGGAYRGICPSGDKKLTEFIEQQDSELTEFDESLALRWLNEIVVWDDRFSVKLKSGVRVEIIG